MVQIVFDSNFDLEKKITLSSRRQKQQVDGVPTELVKDFTVELWKDGAIVAKQDVRDNFQRLCRVGFDGVDCDAVRLVVKSTNGVPEARVFEIRVYS